MHLTSVNIARPRPIERGRTTRMTGIFKTAATGPVEINRLGLTGDAVCDAKHHGGVDQAVYVYGTADYDWWAGELGHTLDPGTFGENLTISDLESASYTIGDRFAVGSVVLEVTAPRLPCGTLASRMDDPGFVKRFRDAERPGLYCRVVQEGKVQAGDPVRHTPYKGEPRVTALELFRDAFRSDQDVATLKRHLAAPIDVRTRTSKEQALRKRLAAQA